MALFTAKIQEWLKRYKARHGSLPPKDFTFPPIVSWLRKQTAKFANSDRANADAYFAASFLLLTHVRNWAEGFQGRLALDSSFGRTGDSFEASRQQYLQVLRIIVGNVDDIFDALGEPTSIAAFQALYVDDPANTAKFIAKVALQWNVAPPAFKFGLLGGFDAVDHVERLEPKLSTYCPYVGAMADCSPHSYKDFPVSVTDGVITESMIKLAVGKLKKFPRSTPAAFGLFPSSAALTRGLNTHESQRGRKKQKDA